MTETATAGSRHEGRREVGRRKRRGRWLVGLLALVAVSAAGILAYEPIVRRGPTITVYFETAEGLEAGKTRLRLASVEIGRVASIALRRESPRVTVRCRIDASARDYMREGVQFWVVHPPIGSGGTSERAGFASEAYIEVSEAPAGAAPAFEFTGLAAPPAPPAAAAGLGLVLHAETLASLGVGSPVRYRSLPVGRIDGYRPSDDGASLEIDISIDPDHASLVRRNSRFWYSGGPEGPLRFPTGAAPPQLAAGIDFDAPTAGGPAERGAHYWLHASRSELASSALRYGGFSVIVEAPRLGALEVGDPVSYREIPVGAVVSLELSRDSRTARAHLNIQNRYAKLVRTNSVFWNASGAAARAGGAAPNAPSGSHDAQPSVGVAFATPTDPGPPVQAGSVFELQSAARDQWLQWSPAIWRGSPDEVPPRARAAEHGLARFFHYAGKSAEDAERDREHQPDAAQAAARDAMKRGRLGPLFRRGEDD
ncbi:MAG: MCE family protein [Deltaproteobacteria bacterium]|nr:MAG: MCE family protein [Deltaproteobacteria bacterium]